MPASTSTYLSGQSLRSRFILDLADAARESRISEQEHQWLRQLADDSAGSQSVLVSPQAFNVICQCNGNLNAALAGAILIADPAGKLPAVYLNTLLGGLERFEDRAALLNALNTRFPCTSPAAERFELEVIDGPLFEYRMLAIVRQQVEYLRAWGQMLQDIPTLGFALGHAFKQCMSSVLAHRSIDLSLPLVQITLNEEHSAASAVVRTLTLEAVALQRLVGETLPASQSRLFLSSRGQIEDVATTQLYEEALSRAVTQIGWRYEGLISEYWSSLDHSGATVREQAARAFAESLHQDLLAARHTGAVSELEFQRIGQLLQPPELRTADVAQVKRLFLRMSNQQQLKLAGLMLFDLQGDLLLYGTVQGLWRVRSLRSLATAEGLAIVRRHLSLNDQTVLASSEVLRIDSYTIEEPPFLDAIDGIIGLQQRNLKVALARLPADPRESAAMIDDALDIRHLLNRRLLHLDGQQRWMEGETLFSERWLASTPPTPVDASAFPVVRSPLSNTWTEQVLTLEDQVQRCDVLRSGIESFARSVLNEQLAIFGDAALDARDIQVQWDDGSRSATAGQPLACADLVTLLLERISGYRSGPIAADAQVAIVATDYAPARPSTAVSPAFINRIFSDIERRFFPDYLRHSARFYQQASRQPFKVFNPGALLADVQEDYLRLEYDLHKRMGKLGPLMLAMFKQVLDLPVRSMRQQSGDEMAEVYTLTLKYDPDLPAAPMSNVFAVLRPARQSLGIVCWSAVTGVSQLPSLETLARGIISWLGKGALREKCLGLFGEADRSRIRERLEQVRLTSMNISFSRVDGHFLHALQTLEQGRQRSTVEQMYEDARRARLSAKGLIRFARLAESDERILGPLGNLSRVVQNLLLQDMIPDWLKQASLDDLNTYHDLLVRYYVNNDPQDDFLRDIPALQDFSREQLINALNAQFPDQALDPDKIIISLTRYVAAPVALGNTPSFLPAATVVREETLTDFALNHFSSFQGAVMTLTLPSGTSPTVHFSAAECEALVRKLDVGGQYQALLATTLDEGRSDYAHRRSRFTAQIPSRMLVVAFELKLQGLMTTAGYESLQSVLDMPDGVARQTVQQNEITLRPLQLLATDGIAPDPVAGIYLIGPRDTSKGPVVVHAMFNQAFSFIEYADQAAFLADLRSSESLQALVLNRLDPHIRKRYDNGGFTEAHIPWSSEAFLDGPLVAPGPVRLADEPVAGNALRYLFSETLKVLKDITRKQTVTSSQADWNSLLYLMRLGTEQILSFVPGRLGMLIALWQSKDLFKASALSAYDWKWGKALSEFSAALGMLIASGNGVDEDYFDSTATLTPPSEEARKPAPAGYTWSNALLTPDLKTRLRVFEVQDVVLEDLHFDPLYNVYRDAQTGRYYAAVEGLVYQVRFEVNRWRIVDAEHLGPRISLNASQRWELDLAGRLLGGGSDLSCFRSSAIPSEIRDSFIIEAQGMHEIRRLYRDKSLMITEAWQLSRYYLESCIYNLGPSIPGSQLDSRTLHIIADFFGVSTPDADLVASIRQLASDLHQGLTDHSLSQLSSRRFIVGTNKPGHEGRAAFIYRSDPERRIYLSELFFQAQEYRLDPGHADYGSFNQAAHARAASLVHELSHIVNHTNDIAYLESSAPFSDLLDTTRPGLLLIKAEIDRLRTVSLSHQTPANQLFRTKDLSGWRDLTERDGFGKARILRITGQANLEQARTVFYANALKRREIMLANADSVTVLLMALGRRRFTASQIPASNRASLTSRED